MTERHARRPVALFLTIGSVFGVAFALLSPPFASPDEATHFFRAYQLSEGTVFAERRGDRAGGPLPSSIDRDVRALDQPGPAPPWSSIREVLGRSPGGPRMFFDFQNTALYPPLTYAPQVAAISAGRVFGLSNLALFYLARLANLAVFLALVAWAAARFPRLPWLPAAVGLLPSSLFLAASVSADGLMIGLCGATLVEALSGRRWRLLVLCLFLGLAKPPYFLVSLACLAVWWVRGHRRAAWHLPAATAVAVLPAVAWSRWADHIFVPYIPISNLDLKVQPSQQIDHLLTHPWRFFEALAATVANGGTTLLRQLLAPGARGFEPSVAVAVAAGAALLAVLLLATRREWRREDRVIVTCLPVVSLLTMLAVAGAVYVYSNEVDTDEIYLVYGRYLLPVLAPLLVWVPQPGWVRRAVAARPKTVDLALGTAMASILFASLFTVS